RRITRYDIGGEIDIRLRVRCGELRQHEPRALRVEAAKHVVGPYDRSESFFAYEGVLNLHDADGRINFSNDPLTYFDFWRAGDRVIVAGTYVAVAVAPGELLGIDEGEATDPEKTQLLDHVGPEAPDADDGDARGAQ